VVFGLLDSFTVGVAPSDDVASMANAWATSPFVFGLIAVVNITNISTADFQPILRLDTFHTHTKSIATRSLQYHAIRVSVFA